MSRPPQRLAVFVFGSRLAGALALNWNGYAVHDAEHDGRETIVFPVRRPHDVANRGLVEVLDATTERVSQQLLGEARHERVLA